MPTPRNQKQFDTKTFLATAIFFFAALIDARDFPIYNLPLIYPCFLIFILMIGRKCVYKGFVRVKPLLFIVFIYWLHYTIYGLIYGRTLKIQTFITLFEPLLVLIAAGTVTVRKEGLRTAIFAFILVVTISTAAGIWIYFIGEPISSFRKMIHFHVGGDLLQGVTSREFGEDIAGRANLNAGLSFYVFLFGYQLAVATFLSLISFFLKGKFWKEKRILFWLILIILIVGVLTNTERASVLSISVGVITFFYIKKSNFFTQRNVTIFLFCIVTILLAINFTEKSNYDKMKKTMIDRFSTEVITHQIPTHVRLINMPLAAISTIFYQPFGSFTLSEHYKKVANKENWFGPAGKMKSSHNHFANKIMYTGVFGLFFTICLFRMLWNKGKFIKKNSKEEIIFVLFAACVTALAHSISHNAGFFSSAPETHIVFGLLWGATARNTLFNNLKGKINYRKRQENTCHYS